MPHVEIEVPYIYEVSYVPPRKRNPVKATLAGKMTVQVESVSGAEAPLVLSWTQDDFGGAAIGNHARAWRGGFATPASRDPVTPETVDPGHLHGYDAYDLRHWRDGGLPEAVEGRLETVLGHYHRESGLQAVEALKEDIRRSAAGCVFVDGVLYRRGELPSIVASIDYRFHGNDVIEVKVGEASERLGAHGMQFGLSDFDAAMAWAEERKEMEGRAEVRCRVEVEIHSPDLLPQGTLLPKEALRLGRFLMDNGGWKLEDLDDGSIMRWMECRRALEAAEAEPSEDNVTAMIESWEALYAAYETDQDARRREYGSGYRKANDIYWKALAGLRTQWETRPIADYGAVPSAP